jgi:hypothetical protein
MKERMTYGNFKQDNATALTASQSKNEANQVFVERVVSREGAVASMICTFKSV